jgi:hypothetical protein
VQDPLLPVAAAPLAVIGFSHVSHCITMYHER